MSSVYLAIDLGATSGRVMAGIVDDQQIKLREINRFPTKGFEESDSWYWDVEDIFSHVIEGLRKANVIYGDRIAGIGVDTWGVDYALLDKNGDLLSNPFMYRDKRTDGIEERIQKIVSPETIYEETGIQFIFLNSINQLFAEKESRGEELDQACDLLFMPDLFNYWLCGEKIQERSMASTSQLLNPKTGAWSEILLDALKFPKHLFKPITEPGRKIGSLLPELQKRIGAKQIPVFAVAGHDTASAVAAASLRADASAFLSSGTWSLMGVESEVPIINQDSLSASFSNEAGVEGTTRFLKNICGMWLVKLLKEEWQSAGDVLGYDTLVDLAREAEPFRSIIDPDDVSFAKPGPITDRIQQYCSKNNQPVPESKAQYIRTVFDSLASKYRIVFDQLKLLSGRSLTELRVVGGGSHNDFLNQCTANALNCPVHAGPIEATSYGNVLMQLRGAERIDSLTSGRQLVVKSFSEKTFLPIDPDLWIRPVKFLRELMDLN